MFVQKTMRNGDSAARALQELGFKLTPRQSAEIRRGKDDIIASKQASNRAKDRETLPRLRGFREYLREPGREHHPRLPELKSQDHG